MSKFIDHEAQAQEDFRREVAAGLGLPVEIVFGDPKQVEPASEVVRRQEKERQERIKRNARRALAALRRALK